MQALIQRLVTHIPRLHGWCTNEKAIALAKTIVDSKCDLSVELGIFGGRGLISMAMAHDHLGSGITWGFDPWTAAAALEGDNGAENDDWWKKVDYESIYFGFVASVVEHRLTKQCYWSRIRSDEAVKQFADHSIGVIHADSNHSEKVSSDEVMRWKDKVKPGGYWFADDTDWATTKKAQGLLVKHGFKLIHDRAKWAIYQKATT